MEGLLRAGPWLQAAPRGHLLHSSRSLKSRPVMRAQVSREKTPGVEGAALPWEEGLARGFRAARVPRQQVPETMDSKQGLKHRREHRPPEDPLSPSPSVVTQSPISSWAPGCPDKGHTSQLPAAPHGQ